MIEIMSESEDNMLVVKATEKLTAGDYAEVLIPKINQLIQDYRKVRVVGLLAENVWDGNLALRGTMRSLAYSIEMILIIGCCRCLRMGEMGHKDQLPFYGWPGSWL